MHRRTVRHEYRDPVPALRASLNELSSDLVGVLVVITPRDALLVADVRQVIRCLPGTRRNDGTESWHGRGR